MAPQGAKKDSFAACFWGKLKLACTIQKVSLTCPPAPTSRIDYTCVELGMSKESIGFFHTSTPWRTTLYKDEKGK